jgi:RNA ligase (TIGR02306 family)
MSTFAVKVTKIEAIEAIPGADKIEAAVIGDYRVVVLKNQFKVGQLGVYIPEGAIVPDLILKRMGLEGKLAGQQKNRVKSIQLRQVLSQGLVYCITDSNGQLDAPFISIPTESGVDVMLPVKEGQDVANDMGIIKWDPPIPIHMRGEVYNAGLENTINFDVENIKAWPDVFIENEDVCITEKIHGSFVCVGILPECQSNENHIMNRFVVFSKGLGSKGLCFKDNKANENNVYLRVLKKEDIFNKMMYHFSGTPYPIFFLGEVFGEGMQDLKYGSTLSFRVFDICSGEPGKRLYMPPLHVKDILTQMNINMVPMLYTGPYSKEKVKELTSGKETVSGSQLHMREGVVIRPVEERRHKNLGRVILKSVSDEYLLRNGINVTEFN